MPMSPREGAAAWFDSVWNRKEPMQKRVDMWGMGMARIADGQIVEGWNAWDFMSLYQQVGMLPAVATA